MMINVGPSNWTYLYWTGDGHDKTIPSLVEERNDPGELCPTTHSFMYGLACGSHECNVRPHIPQRPGQLMRINTGKYSD